jgi:hypothetical protein
MLDEVASHDFYISMNRYLGYNQVLITFEDYHKTIFTIPWGTFVH